MSNKNLLIIITSSVGLWLVFIAYQTHRLKTKEDNAYRPNTSIINYNIYINYCYQGIEYEQNSRI